MVTRSRKSSRPLYAFGLALLTSLALAGIVAGSASALSMSPGAGTTMTGSGGLTTSGGTWVGRLCSGSQGDLKATDGTSGTIDLRLTGCQGPTGYTCTTAGQPAGNIVTPTLKYKLIYLDAAKTKFGLMLIPPTAGTYENLPPPFDTWNGKIIPGSGLFAEFVCGGALSFKWQGSVLGQITSPALNVASNSANLQFTQSGNTQTYRQIEGADFQYQLSETRNGESSKIAINANHLLQSAAKVTFLP